MRVLSRASRAGTALAIVVASVLGIGAPALADEGVSSPSPTSAEGSVPSSAPLASSDPSTSQSLPPAVPTSPVPTPQSSSPASLPGTPPASSVTLTDPTIEAQNAAGDHSMGSTIAANDPAAPAPSGRLSRLSVVSNAPGIDGLDVSAWQTLNASQWATLYGQGARFVYSKATEGTSYVSSQFSEQYNDSAAAGLLHGAYHFATPDTSSGAAQANWFLANGATPTNDGRTLPPLLDIEYNPYGATCYGLPAQAMINWIYDFATTVDNRIGRWPALYTTSDWWSRCTGNYNGFGMLPLFIARYPSNGDFSGGPGTLPAGWGAWTFWQYGSTGAYPGDQDVFNGSLTELQTLGLGTSLVRSTSNATVYLIAGQNKYPVASLPELGALSVLGGVAFVDQSFLDQLATQQAAGRIVRASNGGIFFIDSGIKLSFASCAQVADYGGSCDSSGYMQLTDAQIAAYANGPAVTPLLGTSSGNRYWISGGAKHQVLDDASLAAAGLSAGMNVLSDDAVAGLPDAAPVVRDGVYASTAGSAPYYLLSGGAKYQVDPSSYALSGVASRLAGRLSVASLAQLPNGATAFTGAFTVGGSSQTRVLGSGGSWNWASGAGGMATAPVPVPQAFADSYPVQGTVQAGSAIMSTAGGTVFLAMPTQILPVGAWESLVALSATASPVIVTIPQALLQALPQGTVALTAGTLVRSPADATVYLINGVTNKIPFSSFVFPSQLGVSTFSYTTQARLDAYPTSTQLLGFGVSCGAQKYVAAGGSAHAVSAADATLYPFSWVPLDQFSCALLPKGADADAFIRTPDGSIYQLVGGKKKPISSMVRYQQLSAGKPWLDVASEFAAAIPTGSLA